MNGDRECLSIAGARGEVDRVEMQGSGLLRAGAKIHGNLRELPNLLNENREWCRGLPGIGKQIA